MKQQYFIPTLLLILPFLCLEFPHSNATLTDQSCHQTALPNLCKASIPEPPKEPIGVIDILIGNTRVQASDIEKYLAKLAEGSEGALYVRLTNALRKCVPMWSQASENLRMCQVNVIRKNFAGARGEITSAQNQAMGCFDLFRQYPMLQAPKRMLAGMIRFQGLAKVIDQLVAALH